MFQLTTWIGWVTGAVLALACATPAAAAVKGKDGGAAAPKNQFTLQGKVDRVVAEKDLFVVIDRDGNELAFQLADGARVRADGDGLAWLEWWAERPRPDLAALLEGVADPKKMRPAPRGLKDLNPGDVVTVTYERHDEQLRATEVRVRRK